MIIKQIEDKPLQIGENYWFRYGDIIDIIKLIDRQLIGRNSYYLVSYKNKREWIRADKIKCVEFKKILDVYKYKSKNENFNTESSEIENNFIAQQKIIELQIEKVEKNIKKLEQKIIKRKTKERIKKGYSSYPEFLCYTILTYCKDSRLINSFKTQVTFDFASDKRYDFLIDEKIILETHGMQHYETNMYNTTTKEQRENDKLKRKLAEQNGLIYFEIDCRWSKFDYCYENIMKALSNVTDTDKIEKEKIGELCKTPFHEKVLKLWNEGLSTGEISNKLNVSIHKIQYELNRLNEMNLIEYNFDIAFQRGMDKRMEKRNKEALILIEIKTGNVKRFKNKYELAKDLKINISTLDNHISGRTKTLRNQFVIKKEEEFEEDKVNEYICETGTLKWTYFLKKDGIEYVYFNIEKLFSATYKRDEITKALLNSEKDTIFYLGFEIRREKLNQKNFKLGRNQKFGTREITSVNDSGLIYIAINPETGEIINSYTQRELIENKLTPASVRNACPSKDGIIPTDRYGNRRKYKGYYWEKVIKK